MRYSLTNIIPVLSIIFSKAVTFSSATTNIDSDINHHQQEEIPIPTPTPIPIALTNYSVPLFAAKNSHHVHVYVGSPPQRRIVIVDTGSRVLVFPCEPCYQCGTKHVSGSYFDQRISSTDFTNTCNQCHFSSHLSTCSKNHCTFKQSYSEGSSLSGYEVEDIIWLGTKSIQQSVKQYMTMAVPMTFGCQTSEKGLVASQYADGIMGLSFSNDKSNNNDNNNNNNNNIRGSNRNNNNNNNANANANSNNIITKMFMSNSIPNHAFSMCMTRSKGILSLGGTSLSYHEHNDHEHNDHEHNDHEHEHEQSKKKKHLEQMKTVPISKNHGYYSITIKDFQLGDRFILSKDGNGNDNNSDSDREEKVMNIFNEGKGTIIDSGTSDTYLPKMISTDFRKIWKELTNLSHSNALMGQYTFDEFQKLPNITLTLEGDEEKGGGEGDPKWIIQPNQYMEPTNNNMVVIDEENLNSNHKWDGKRGFYNRIYLDEPKGAVLGANAMIDHDILFDIGNKRIGIAAADCSV